MRRRRGSHLYVRCESPPFRKKCRGRESIVMSSASEAVRRPDLDRAPAGPGRAPPAPVAPSMGQRPLPRRGNRVNRGPSPFPREGKRLPRRGNRMNRGASPLPPRGQAPAPTGQSHEPRSEPLPPRGQAPAPTGQSHEAVGRRPSSTGRALAAAEPRALASLGLRHSRVATVRELDSDRGSQGASRRRERATSRPSCRGRCAPARLRRGSRRRACSRPR